MSRLVWTGLAVAVLLSVSACGEKPQTQGGSKADANPYTGTGSNFASPGWKPGDKTSWEQHMRARTQNTQNEYTRVN